MVVGAIIGTNKSRQYNDFKRKNNIEKLNYTHRRWRLFFALNPIKKILFFRGTVHLLIFLFNIIEISGDELMKSEQWIIHPSKSSDTKRPESISLR